MSRRPLRGIPFILPIVRIKTSVYTQGVIPEVLERADHLFIPRLIGTGTGPPMGRVPVGQIITRLVDPGIPGDIFLPG